MHTEFSYDDADDKAHSERRREPSGNIKMLAVAALTLPITIIASKVTLLAGGFSPFGGLPYSVLLLWQEVREKQTWKIQQNRDGTPPNESTGEVKTQNPGSEENQS